ncbi:hypothetical protein C2845_PM17G03640 [Panicum miliaceum]|uniref:Uncharacterized protein n=1 Tax=Panicum miliaceum TaxID=4540 RepID=A0A3L6Q2B4_PANMI|nr:hypothetical protein C2845_PM17G03640 [Panicum miliaceum]
MAQGGDSGARYRATAHALRTIYAEEEGRVLWKGLLPGSCGSRPAARCVGGDGPGHRAPQFALGSRRPRRHRVDHREPASPLRGGAAPPRRRRY